MTQPLEEVVETTKENADLSCQLKLLAQRVDSGFNYQTERITEAKKDLTGRLDSVERRLEFYGRVFVGAIIGLGGVLSALSTAVVGRFMQWW
ncbi:hypothetical protein ACHMW6_29160 [Pseudoduganella sp. UC29_106]|uniref:hypothetical protein n=1 Tax=Pseudoduganella sp. UC29_106 TaxID=3374553 RepID=UPI00375758B1